MDNKMITIKMRADGLIFRDVTPAVKKDILGYCDRVTNANLTPYLSESKGGDLYVTADHSDLYQLMYSLTYKYDFELV